MMAAMMLGSLKLYAWTNSIRRACPISFTTSAAQSPPGVE